MPRQANTNGRRPKIEHLSQQQVLDLLDRRARRVMGISGEEFLRRFREGQLENSPEESSLTVLAELVR